MFIYLLTKSIIFFQNFDIWKVLFVYIDISYYN